MEDLRRQDRVLMTKIAILGFGTVGGSLAKAVRMLGVPGLEITHVYNRDGARTRTSAAAGQVGPDTVWTENIDDVLRSDVDVVAELVGGMEPAGTWIEGALKAGKSVVTANKQLIAYRGPELARLAAKNGVQLLHGAAVAGGVPVIPGILQGLSGDSITRVSGILNGTCNYILSRMEAGDAYAGVLKDAQKLGYAEADPTADVG
jgi:homoserine dehydrogenase